jgi:CheY-like chemotaxis protein
MALLHEQLVMHRYTHCVLSGKETLAILKSSEEYSSIPTVVFTTSSGELDQMYCQRLGTAMITKPVQYIQLRAAIETALSHRRPLTFRKRFRK